MTTWIGVSLKMYFSHERTRGWCDAVHEVASRDRAVVEGATELVVLPTFVSIPLALDAFAGTGVRVGAQDVAAEEAGAWTGEVSASELHEVGCRYVEVGHAERRRHFSESPAVVAAKVRAAWRHGLSPVLCVGEPERVGADLALKGVTEEVRSALEPARAAGLEGHLVVAYEPQWAIGQSAPAPIGHVVEVSAGLRELVVEEGISGRVVYGGSAGPGLLDDFGDAVDGLFLGRFAHDPDALRDVLGEAARRSSAPA